MHLEKFKEKKYYRRFQFHIWLKISKILQALNVPITFLYCQALRWFMMVTVDEEKNHCYFGIQYNRFDDSYIHSYICTSQELQKLNRVGVRPECAVIRLNSTIFFLAGPHEIICVSSECFIFSSPRSPFEKFLIRSQTPKLWCMGWTQVFSRIFRQLWLY